MKNYILKKILVTGLTIVFLVMQTVPVLAIEVPDAPSVPSQPTTPTLSNEPTTSSTPEAPSPPPPPSLSDDPEENTNESNSENKAVDSSTDSGSSPTPTPTTTPAPASSQQPQTNESAAKTSSSPPPPTLTGQTADGQTGDATVITGDATNSGVITNLENSNMATSPQNGTSGGSVGVINTGNGSQSTSSGAIEVAKQAASIQENLANISNSGTLHTNTGNNSASRNIGDSAIVTGDANTTATVITAANTNVDGVSLAEFNIADDHVGDIILNFSTACIAGCSSPTTVENAGNGSNSTNNSTVTHTENNQTFQNNDGTVGNDVILSANSGDNTASENTNGDSIILTGDANVAANVATFLNNNIAGKVILGVVNIFGDLIGDIILPQSVFTALNNGESSNGATVTNSGNGSDSTNTSTDTDTSEETTFQANLADIENNVKLNASTGDNQASGNTGDNTYIQSGDADVNSQTLNIANTNLEGGNWWLVIVNKAGQWFGKIVGAPEGSQYAGSSGMEFTVGEDGEVTAVNAGNGSGSDNTTTVEESSETTVVQENTAKVVNNLDLSANTGGNQASNNTGGESVIKTGDATAIATLVNFVNNNIVGDSTLVVTLVNVFKNWKGNFLPPGTEKPASDQTTDTAEAIVPDASSQSGQEDETILPSPAPTVVAQSNSSDSNSTGNPAVGGFVFNQNMQKQPLSVPVLSNGTPITSVVKDSLSQTEVTFNPGEILGFVSNAENTGSSIAATANSDAPKKVEVNLAWSILGVPLMIITALIRRKFNLPEA